MRRKVLDSLVSRNSLVGIVVLGHGDAKERANRLAHSLCGGAPFFCTGYSPLDGPVETFLSGLKAKTLDCRHAFVVLGDSLDGASVKLLGSMRMSIVISGDGPQNDDLLSDLESLAPFPPGFFWWVAPPPAQKRFVHLYKIAKRSSVKGFVALEDLEAHGEEAAKIFIELQKDRILLENALEGAPLLFRRLFPLLCILAFALPFLVPTELSPSPTMSRNLKSEKAVYADAPFFDFPFDGSESLERIARYAIGRFAAVVSTGPALEKYIGETLERNDFPKDAWKKDVLHIPPAATSLRFYAPAEMTNPAYDSIAPVWKYFTGILGDSVAYVTELYHPVATAKNRLHPAWDVAGRSGARILAPFSGRAWTFKDERGGTVIGIADAKRVILFMHCDQLLYLDGQNVMQGDPVATVGMTGHTTGPHVHLVTGFVDKRGTHRLGNVNYNIVNPVTWFYASK